MMAEQTPWTVHIGCNFVMKTSSVEILNKCRWSCEHFATKHQSRASFEHPTHDFCWIGLTMRTERLTLLIGSSEKKQCFVGCFPKAVDDAHSLLALLRIFYACEMCNNFGWKTTEQSKFRTSQTLFFIRGIRWCKCNERFALVVISTWTNKQSCLLMLWRHFYKFAVRNHINCWIHQIRASLEYPTDGCHWLW